MGDHQRIPTVVCSFYFGGCYIGGYRALRRRVARSSWDTDTWGQGPHYFTSLLLSAFAPSGALRVHITCELLLLNITSYLTDVKTFFCYKRSVLSLLSLAGPTKLPLPIHILPLTRSNQTPIPHKYYIRLHTQPGNNTVHKMKHPRCIMGSQDKKIKPSTKQRPQPREDQRKPPIPANPTECATF